MEGIRITPPVVEFHDARPDVFYRIPLSIQNLSKDLKKIRIHAPVSENFQVICKNDTQLVAPGLEMNAFIEYYNKNEEDCKSEIVLFIGEKIAEIPLIALKPKPAMEITSPVEFGTCIADGRVIRKEVAILNRGSENGKFKLVYEGDEPITMIPTQGIVKAGYSQPVRFEFICKKSGILKEIVSVNLEGQQPLELQIFANVTKRSLQLLSMDDETKIGCVDFGSTYYGTDVLKSYVLHNHSPDEVNFVVILEEEGEGQELGVDLSLTKSMPFSDISITQPDDIRNYLTSLVTACPSQGILKPYDKILLHFKFSPRASKSNQGWSATNKPQPRRDFALFVHIDIVENIESHTDKDSNSFNDARVEVALTGTALPVLMSVLPSPILQFDNCQVGKHLDCCVTIKNESNELPLHLIVPKSAHFVPLLQSHNISPNADTDLLISFRPNQIGQFKPKMDIVITGYTCEIGDEFTSLPKFKQIAIFKFPIQVEGVSLPVIGQKTSKSLSAQGRLYPQPSDKQNIDLIKTSNGSSLRILSSDDTNYVNNTLLPIINKRECKTGKTMPIVIAQPDNRATSIRPTNKKEKIITRFTKIERHSYVDPDYEYTEHEEEERRQHRQKYIDYIEKLRVQKIEKRKASEFKKLDNIVDIGIKSGYGLRATKLTLKEIYQHLHKDEHVSKNSKPEDQLLSSKEIERKKLDNSKMKVTEGLKAIATTATETTDCSKILTPQELYQVFIAPKTVDFGEVCTKSIASKKLKIANNLKYFIHIKFDIECRELRQTSPLSQVIPPGRVAALALHFESNCLGMFERSLSYTINGKHKGHVIVSADVVNVTLSLSSDELLLSPCAGLPPEAGMRKTFTLYNQRNAAAEFSWLPVVGKDGTAFSVRPARGTVNPFSNLECEVVFYPSFYAPLSGLFQLRVDSGNSLELQTLAEIGPASCSFVEHRLMFGSVPLNLETKRSAFLKNTSSNHAFFKVVEPSPIPGLIVTPKTGIVPVGGTTELMVTYKPLSVQKFDTQIDVAIRGWKSISLRMGGHVEPPCVNVNVDSFQFGGVYCGATAVIPFQLKNLARSRAVIVFDLSLHRDFILRFGNDDYRDHEIPQAEGCYEVTLIGQEELNCFLEFNPGEVASYDFIISAIINQTAAPTPPPSPYPASVVLSKSGYNSETNELTKSIQYATPSRRVQATALRPPLQVSNTKINIMLPSGYYDMGIETTAGRTAGIMFVNNSNRKLKWSFDVEKRGTLLENGVFQFLHRSGSPYLKSSHNAIESTPSKKLESGETSQVGILFTPPEPGTYKANIPIILNDDKEKPYRMVSVHGELQSPSLSFEPSALHFTPVPLRTSISMDFNIIAKGYRKAVNLGCHIPKVELEDGSEVEALDVSFPNGKIIHSCCQDAGDKEPFILQCQISFCAEKRVSFITSVTFVTEQQSYKLPVIATADNCLLSCYNFLAIHQSDYHVICEELTKKANNNQSKSHHDQNEEISYGEALFIPCVSAIRCPTENSQITTSTSFGLSSSAYPESTAPSSARSASDINEKEEDQEETSTPYEFSGTEDTSSDSEEEKYIREICRTVQRWFSSQAWSSGPNPISLPFSLRSSFETGVSDGGTTRSGTWSREKKDSNKTVFDIVNHFCGKSVPGIPINASLPSEPFERTKHLFWMYSTLLAFLRCQGAMVASIKPEYLLGRNDFERWVLIRETEMRNSGEKFYDESLQKENDRYEILSRHTWVDLLLQIIKVMVLNRITPQNYRKIILPDQNIQLPALNADPLCSNVYSVGERILLAWINHHYEQQRNAEIWKTSINGSYPSSRWIVNFDNDFLDGLVLVSLLIAHTPFLAPKFLTSMYTKPNTAEQCLHNALKVVDAMRYLGFDYDIVATDITEPNPVGILLLCIYLYHRLPNYIPRTSIEFSGPLHADVTKHVKLRNPSPKPLIYQIIIAGDNASHFSVKNGKSVKVPPKSQLQLPVIYRSNFLRPCTATLMLVGKRLGSQVGSTLVFNLTTSVDTITPMATIKTDSPCYELKKVNFEIKNPFNKSAYFKILLVEARQTHTTPRTTKKTKQGKLKNVESKTDHGVSKKNSQRKEESLRDSQTIPYKNQSDIAELNMSSFWCPMKEVDLHPHSSAKIQVEFLPFNTGHHQCSLLFLNEEVGEFVYSIEADAVLPLPSVLPYQPSACSVRVNNASTTDGTCVSFDHNERAVYWQCEVNEEITEDVQLPLVNQAKENALVIAAQQRMSEKELKRREMTGCLSISTISLALQSMGLSEQSVSNSSAYLQTKNSEIIGFVVENNSQFFKLPKIFDMRRATNKDDDKGTTKFPISFIPDGPGHYQCRIVLRAPNDVRVYQIECTVNPEGSGIELEFTSPTHEYVTQNIPIVNNSERDWNLLAKIKGDGFSGPDKIFCPKMTSSSFPLTFRPMYEGIVKGDLMLFNTTSGTETVFQLSGIGKKPLQLDHIEIRCQIGESATCELKIPNVTSKKMVFQTFCDIDFVDIPGMIKVLPKQTATVMISLKPWKRGIFDGKISFLSDDDVTKKLALDKAQESDDDDDDDDDVSLPNSSSLLSSKVPSQHPDLSSFTKPYRIWYSIRIESVPAPPKETISIDCPTHDRVTRKILVENPLNEKIEFDVTVEGPDLIAGDDWLMVHPKAYGIYEVDFAPKSIGQQTGRVIFQNPMVGEIWYELLLTATTQPPKELKFMQCPLGTNCHQMIRLDNPTDDYATFSVQCSNMHNFRFDLHNHQIELPPHSGIEVPLSFSPSALGLGQHKAEITFSSEKLGDLIYYVTGSGQSPVPFADHVIQSSIKSSSSTIIQFENPFEEDIIVSIELNERPFSRSGFFFTSLNKSKNHQEAFSHLLKQSANIVLAPRKLLDIPICFSPNNMVLHEATCSIIASKADESPFDIHHKQMKWIFPIKGIPQSTPIKDSKAPRIECRSRERLEKQLELSFTGITLNTLKSTQLYEEPDVGLDYTLISEDFKYEFEFPDTEAQVALERSVGLNLIRKVSHRMTSAVTLIFDIIFAPSKSFTCLVHLIITAASGGVWRYPLKFIATEPKPDDVIEMQAIGLNKKVSVAFRLTSQTSLSVPFWASLETHGDQMFTVTPISGELPSTDSEGLLFKVSYCPKYYGKVHAGKLVIQTSEMQWIYEIRGALPDCSPNGKNQVTVQEEKNKYFSVKQKPKNFIRDNLFLKNTAVSSPIKGQSIIQKRHKVL